MVQPPLGRATRSVTTASTPRGDIRDASADPFRERSGCRRALSRQILGARFRFESASEALLQQVEAAYGGLPPHQLPTAVPEFRVELRLSPPRLSPGGGEPPPVQTQAGAGWICGVMDASNYVMLAPAQQRALVVASADMLERPYHLRYELIEFAVFTLATRGQGLVPLHGACVGRRGRGVLLLGASGSGKSTLALLALLQGLDFLAEDAVFVQPHAMLATGVANYLHVQADALRFVDAAGARRWIGEAPVIRRRSGMEKFEADLRRGPGRLAAAPLELVGAVLVSARPADDSAALLSAVRAADVATRLSADQPYASGQPGWPCFARRMMAMGVHELRRGKHPRDGVAALRELLGDGCSRPG
ncbi:serine kinase [Rhodanobacter denitrificans]|uniref:serine kinase n=1 Tax=Rhodanobacter denitrificans TaxID=666685 RepID=UPI003CCE3699